MYYHWYVATVNQLTQKETAVFLSTLEILENDALPYDLRRGALFTLRHQFDLNLQVYALPSLLQTALSQSISHRNHAVHLVQEICGRTNNRTAKELAQNLNDVEKLLGILQSYLPGYRQPDLLSEGDYIEIYRHPDQVMAFAILRSLPTESVIGLLEGDHWSNLLRRALKGELGRYALLLAAEITNTHQVTLPENEYQDLLPFRGVYYAQPDMLWAWLCLQTVSMSPENCLGIERPIAFNRAAQEKETGDAISWLFQGREKTDADATSDEINAVFQRFWNFSRWLLSVRRALRKDARALTLIAEKLSDEWKLERDNGQDAKTPWVFRRHDNYDKRKYSFSEYGRHNDQIWILKAALAMPILGTVLSHLGDMVNVQGKYSFLCDLSLNLYDALAGEGVKSYIDYGFYIFGRVGEQNNRPQREIVFSVPVISLLSYARSQANQIGKGYYNKNIPKLYVDRVKTTAVPLFNNCSPSRNTQEKYLHSGASIMVCAFLAYEEASGVMPVVKGHRCWTSGGANSLAAEVCRIALNDYVRFLTARGEDTSELLGKPISLAYEHYPEVLNKSVMFSQKGNIRDWLKVSDELKDVDFTLTESEVLLKTYDAKFWNGTDPITMPQRMQSSYGEMRSNIRYSRFFIALTIKLMTIFKGDVELTDKTSQDMMTWIGVVASLYQKYEYSRTARFVSIELLEQVLSDNIWEELSPLLNGQVIDPVPQADLRDIAQVALERMMDLSRDTLFYQYMIGSVLANYSGTNVSILNMRRIYFSILLEQSLYRDLNAESGILPHELMEGMDTVRNRFKLLLWFVGRISSQIKEDHAFRSGLVTELNRVQYRNSECKTVKIGADSIIEVEASGEESSLYDRKNWNDLWDPDTLACAARQGTPLQVETLARKTNAGWSPQEKGFIAYLLEQAYEENGPSTLTLIDADDTGILVSAAPGRNYRLSADCWDKDSFTKLRGSISEATEYFETSSAYGLYLDVEVVENQDIPLLHFLRVRTDNLRYRTLFLPDGSYSQQDLGKIMNQYSFLTLDYRGNYEYYCLQDSGWDTISQRCRKVGLSKDDVVKSLNCRNKTEAEVVNSLLAFHEGQILKSATILSREQSINMIPSPLRAFTREGVMLWVDSDSVSQDHYVIQDSSITNAKLVLKRVPGPQKGTSPNGVIWTLNVKTRKADIKYLDNEKRIQTINGCKTDTWNIRNVFCGMPVCVENGHVTCAQNLQGKPMARNMIARRLWTMEEPEGKATIQSNQLYLGEYYHVDRLVYLVQDHKAGTLYAYNSPPDSFQTKNFGIDMHMPFKVSATNANLPRGAVVAECRQGSKTYYGEATSGVFSSAGVECERISVRLEEWYDEDKQEMLYDVRRVFDEPKLNIDEAIGESEESVEVPFISQNERLAKQYLEAYQSWITDSEWNMEVEGKFESTPEGLHFLPECPLKYLPIDRDNPSADDPGQWLSRISVCPEDYEELLPFGHPRVRIRIAWHDEKGIGAYPKDTTPFNLERFRKWLVARDENLQMCKSFPLYFVKSVGGILSFEWGTGFRLNVDTNRFFIGSYIGDEKALYYGDSIKQYALERSGRNLCLKVRSMVDCEISIEHRIDTFGKEENNQIRGKLFVKISYDPRTERIKTRLITEPREGKESMDDAPWEFRSYRTGFLDEASSIMVREKMPVGGEAFILARPKWDSNALKMYYQIVEPMQGDTLCLMGGSIEPIGGGNDYRIPFSAPFGPEEYLGDVNAFNVKVNRRQFSFRESTLRTYFNENRQNAFCSHMFVKLQNTPGNQNDEWNGSIIDVRWNRDRRVVSKWLQSENEPQYAVIGETFVDNNNIQMARVEIRPGIFCIVYLKGEPKYKGTVKLFLDNHKIVRAEAISDSDFDFSDKGRTVELLPKNKRLLDNPQAAHFTVAGLPHIELKNQQLGLDLLKTKPPRYGVMISRIEVPRNRHIPSDQIEACENGQPDYGYLKLVGPQGRKRIALFMNNNSQQEDISSFHHLSFLDGSVNDLRKHIARGRWHYHDKTTIIETDGENYKPYTYGENCNLPVLFDKNGSLRYRASELMKYAFPPHELEEFGLSGTENCYYPLAGKEKDAIYIELLPGRIVRLPLKQCRLDFATDTAEALSTDDLAGGDMIRLVTRETEPGKPLEISVSDIRYGLRSFIQGTAFLKVQEWRNGCIALGSEEFCLRVPCLWPKTEQQPEIMCVTGENDLKISNVEEFPANGNLVFVSIDGDGNLRANGFPDTDIILSDSVIGGWDSSFWLKHMLARPDRRREILKVMGGSLPLRVEEADIDRKRLTVFYPQPAMLDSGKTLCAQLLGKMNDTWLLFRAGTRLMLIDMSFVLHTEGKLTKAILDQNPIRKGETLWVRYCGDAALTQDYRTGFDREKNEAISVRILSSIDSEAGSGYLCENIRNHEWLWMPVKNVARAKDATAEAVMGVLQKYYGEQVVLSVCQDKKSGFVSWLLANEYYRTRFNQMKTLDNNGDNATVNVRIVAPLNTEQETLYLCYERPRGNIYQLRSESNQDENSLVTAVCWEKTDTCAELIPAGEQRKELLLSQYFLKTFRKAWRQEDGAITQWANVDLYYTGQNTGDLWSELFDLSRRKFQFDFERTDPADPSYAELIEKIDGMLMLAKGEIEQLPRKYRRVDPVGLPVYAALAIGILTEARYPEKGQQIYKLLYEEADLYCCEERLLKDWLLRKENRQSKYDSRRILERVDLRGTRWNGKGDATYDGTLTQKQLSNLQQVTEILLRRTTHRNATDIPGLALSLRYAVDRKKNPSIEKIWKACDCNQFAVHQTLDSLLADNMFMSWFDRFVTPELAHICVRDSARIGEMLSNLME